MSHCTQQTPADGHHGLTLHHLYHWKISHFKSAFFPISCSFFFHSPGISLKPPTFHLITFLFWLFFHTALQRIKYPLDCIVHFVLFICKVCLYWKSSVRWAESCLLWDHYLKEVFYRECWVLLFWKVLLFRISSA